MGVIPDKLAFSLSSGNRPSAWNNHQIIREELFGVERLEAHARTLAAAQAVGIGTRSNSLTARLSQNGEALHSAFLAISQASDQGHAITPAAEWLIDNYHLVEQQFREVKSDLPAGYYRQLPKLLEGPFADYPRVFGIAWAFVAHSDSRFDVEVLRRFILAYQEVSPLTIGELWALSITLRIVLVENLRRLADMVVNSRANRKIADDVADRLLGTKGKVPEAISTIEREWDNAELADAFSVQLLMRLRDQDGKTIPALAWLERRLAASGKTPEQVVSNEHLRQGSATVSVSNIITSLRMITSVDWAEVFETISLVDKMLDHDPLFHQMDFSSRNLFRNAVETLARNSKFSELEIAHRALAALPDQSPGVFLIGRERAAFEKSIQYRQVLGTRLAQFCRSLGIWGYIGGISVCTMGFLAVALWLLLEVEASAAWLALLGILVVLPLSDAATALVNRILSRLIKPQSIPALELKDGIPASLRTLIVVPTLLTSLENVRRNLEGMEVHHLASPEGEVYFALLSDWVDAPHQLMPGDAALLEAAVTGIAGLNRRYPAGPAGPRFALLHRERRWSASEKCWLGWERKRGKLHQLNRLLRGAEDTGFLSAPATRPYAPAGVRYVITLDADTQLPRETVRLLVGKMAHPLNAPQFDAGGDRVIDGYGILQPRVTPSLLSTDTESVFHMVFSSPGGIDPYAAAVSDVYQDLLGEGSFAGKGIYDVDAFEQALAGRVPDSALLSHDLFEGIFARAGMASDVEVIEEFPARYDVATMRQHRWVRGDWQLLPWILGAGPKIGGIKPSRVPALGRWKMIDNLRRSLSPPMAVLALLAGWTMRPSAALVWTALMVLAILTPAMIPIIGTLLPARAGIPLLSHLRALAKDFGFALLHGFFVLVFLADQACSMVDAIGRTIYRLYFSRANLLEWVSHAQALQGSPVIAPAFFRRMARSACLGLIALALALAAPDASWLVAAPMAALWIAAPFIAWLCSRPAGLMAIAIRQLPFAAGWLGRSAVFGSASHLTLDDATHLRLMARRTWRFFETFVTPGDHMLPPDNFQETPAQVVAHRTSPTNIGLYLLSVASARDFGWISTQHAVERILAALATMDKLQRENGHFLNWYDTQTLLPLEPQYISTVDSGNLAGHLLALARACREWAGAATPRETRQQGISDALELAILAAGTSPEAAQLAAAIKKLTSLAGELRQPVASGDGFRARLAQTGIDIETCAQTLRAEHSSLADVAAQDARFWVETAGSALQAHLDDMEAEISVSLELSQSLQEIEARSRAMALEMQFGFLLDPVRKLLSIGYVVHERVLDANCYDLVASEARLASFFAIAKGDIPARHWFRLGRAVVLVARRAALISWSGSMFEYLMPALVMRAPGGSLLAQTSQVIVKKQIEYGQAQGVPWGISESAYNVRDFEFTYQYSNFGVPGLGLKRGLDANLVIAPYATALAAMVDPSAAARNFEKLARAGGLGRFGCYEALDYTPSRLPEGETVAVVAAYMAHHQGMSIVAIANALLNSGMRTRFHADPLVQASELLLQERVPRDVVVALQPSLETRTPANLRKLELPGGRFLAGYDAAAPATHLLSNGQYSVMLTSAGSGYSRWRDIALSRWREDPTCDDWGSFVYLRDNRSGSVWSAGYQPVGTRPDSYEVTLNEDRAIFTRHDASLVTTLEVVVSSEDNAEVRVVTLVNTGSAPREIEITSFMELALTTQASDLAHPAFAKMFVQTEYLPGMQAVVATRRRRSPEEAEIWIAQLAVVDGQISGSLEIETDRARFIGRNGTCAKPAAMSGKSRLSGTTGTVLDPCLALRARVLVAAGGTAKVAFWTLVESSRTALLDCIDRHRDRAAFTRAATLAWTQAQVQLHHIGITSRQAALFQRMAGHLLISRPSLRSASETIARGAGPQSGLWGMSISGDVPILLLRISDTDHLDLVRQLLQAHEYLRMKHFRFDLVILNERSASYVQDLQSEIEALIRASQARRPAASGSTTGSTFVVRADLAASEQRGLLLSVARAVLVGQRGSLEDQLDRAEGKLVVPALPVRRQAGMVKPAAAPTVPALEFFNEFGGFADDGREYVIVLPPGKTTPAPWINVIANPVFGFQVAAEGAGYTWSVNSRENQLTPWSNDPVGDRPGEVIYLRDDMSGEIWSATPGPCRQEGATYVTRHGRGYSRFQHNAQEIALDLVQFVPMADPVKISRLTLRNLSARRRNLSVSAYAEWVLGPARSTSAGFVVTSLDQETGAVLATNAWTQGFAGRVAFLDLAGRQTECTGDRQEFIGRSGDLSSPAGVGNVRKWSGKVGAGIDPCGALRTSVTLGPGEMVELLVLLGQGADLKETRSLIARYRRASLDAELAQVQAYWNQVLGKVQVKTPDRSMDIMLNGWLLYQSLACRVWARSAFYQASGAYGFRDQLQDGMALAFVRPDLTRAHLLRSAGRHFVEGDVQHWWWPSTGLGVRTRITDDRAWLAYTTQQYIETTGDTAVLDESVPYLEGQWLREGEHDSLFLPMVSDHRASLYEHCALAIDKSLALGSHGLPLMGSGDWNDGMNLVGAQGRGESVWLAWLHCATIRAFAPIAESRDDRQRAEKWRDHARALGEALETQAWDGEWYRRGFFDDGTPLGSRQSDECQIDAIAQSWAVISGAADPVHARQAMESVSRDLIQQDRQLALLFKPPFDKTMHEPGYIKGYPPGLRENGGQYTHGALWSVIAFAMLGEGDKAAGLFGLLNPVNHARTARQVGVYRTEPYVVAADVYALAPHAGRGGWTWYTGSAGWMHRAGIENILGLKFRAGFMLLEPCIPKDWPKFSLRLTLGETIYEIEVENSAGVCCGIASAELDGTGIDPHPLRIALASDGQTHVLKLRLGPA